MIDKLQALNLQPFLPKDSATPLRAPMTDLETMLAMLARAKIEYSRLAGDGITREPGFTVLTVERGYCGFVSDLIFDAARSAARLRAPMTDLETVLTMLARAKIEYSRLAGDGIAREPGFTILTSERGVSDLIFDETGALVSIEASE